MGVAACRARPDGL